MATLWNESVLVSCLGGTKMDCCNASWLLLQDWCTQEMVGWCIEQQLLEYAVFCSNTMATLYMSETVVDKRHWHSLFLPSSNGVQQEEVWKQYVHGGWNEETIMSPFAHDNTSSSPVFSANIQSTLSLDGGMHRLLHHDITVKCPLEANDSDSYQALLTVLVFCTEYLFVDVNDAILVPNETFAMLVSKERIDIEQPAFVSPQHVVAIQLAVQGLCSDTVPHTFATKLHVRYPPLSRTGERNVVFPAPLLFPSGSRLDTCQQHYTLSTDDFTWQPPITISVATGYERDYYWVGITTIVSSLVGSFLLLRTLSKVSKWS